MNFTNEKENNKLNEEYEYYKRQGIEFFRKEQFNDAVIAYKKCLDINPKQIQVMGELCWCLGQIEKYEEMLDVAKKALLISQKRCSKDNIGRFYFYIAQYYKIKKDYEVALKYFSLSVINKPYFISNYIDAAYCNIQLENYKSAINLYNEIKDIDSGYFEKYNIQQKIDECHENRKNQSPELLHFEKGLEYSNKGDLKKANEEFFKSVYANSNGNSFCLFFLFFNEISLGEDWFKTISIGENLLIQLNKADNEEDSADFLEKTYFGLSKCYEKIGDIKKASEYLRFVECYSHINKAIKAEKAKENEKALEEYKAAFFINKYLHIVLDGLINTSFNLNQLDEAIDYAVIGIKKSKSEGDNENLAKYYFYIGSRYHLFKYKKAIEFYQKAFDSTNNLQKKLLYCRKIAFCYSDNSESRKCIEYLYRCKDIINKGATDYSDIDSEIIRAEELDNPNSDLSKSIEHYNKGGKYYNNLMFEEAVKEMKLSLHYVPQDLDTMDILNRCLHKLKRYDECFEVAYEGFLISLRDKDFRFYDMFCYNIANCYYNKKQYDLALKYYCYALKEKPYDVDYLYFVGACHRNLGNFDEAVKIFKIAHKYAPDDYSISEQIAFCESKLSN